MRGQVAPSPPVSHNWPKQRIQGGVSEQTERKSSLLNTWAQLSRANLFGHTLPGLLAYVPSHLWPFQVVQPLMQRPRVALPIQAHLPIKGPDKDSERWQKDQGPGLGQGSQRILESGSQVLCRPRSTPASEQGWVSCSCQQSERGLAPLPGINPGCSGAVTCRTGEGRCAGLEPLTSARALAAQSR